MKISTYLLDNQLNTKIAIVSDQHGLPCAATLKALRKIQPDLIIAAGDMFDRKNVKTDQPKQVRGILPKILQSVKHSLKRAYLRRSRIQHPCVANSLAFFRHACSIAPVVFVAGNHDHTLSDSILATLGEYGVEYLENESRAVKLKNGKTVTIGGLSETADYVWLQRFARQTSSLPKILICHRPERITKHLEKKQRDTFVLIACGHTHGGQWKIFGKGLYAPGQGILPRYDSGRFGNMIISAGAANPAPTPRFGNPCEIAAVQLRI